MTIRLWEEEDDVVVGSPFSQQIYTGKGVGTIVAAVERNMQEALCCVTTIWDVDLTSIIPRGVVELPFYL